MQDPFQPASNAKLFREAQVGLALIALLLILFVYVAYYRISGTGKTVPEHVLNAPIAETVWPFEYVAGSPPGSSQSESYAASSSETGRALSVNRFPVESRLPGKPVRSVRPPVESTTGVAAALAGSGNRAPRSVRHSNFEQPLESAPVTGAVGQLHSITVDRARMPALSEKHAPSQTRNKKLADDPFGMAEVHEPIQKTPLQESRLQSKPQTVTSIVRDPKRTQQVESQCRDNDFHPRMICPRPIPDDESNTATSHLKSPIGSAPNTRGQFNSLRDRGNDFQVSVGKTLNSPPVDDRRGENDHPANGRPIPEKSPGNLVFESATQLERPDSFVDGREAVPLEGVSHAANERFHTVVQGDSFWGIAQHRYGDGRYFHSLFEHNRHRVSDFESLIPGTRIETPPVDELHTRYPGMCPRKNTGKDLRSTEFVSATNFANSADVVNSKGRSGIGPHYVTRPGDTLFLVAATRLGQASRYLELLNLNQDRIPAGLGHLTELQPGTVLRLPVD